MLKLILLFQLIVVPLKGYRHEGIRDSTQTFVVIHSDETNTPNATLAYLKRTHKSYHYFITRTGKIYNLVNPKYSANHAGWSLYKGKKNWNSFSIGIAFANNKIQPFTDAQYKSGKMIIQYLEKRYHFTDDKIVTHSQIAGWRGKIDPGPLFDMDRIRINTPVSPKE